MNSEYFKMKIFHIKQKQWKNPPKFSSILCISKSLQSTESLFLKFIVLSFYGKKKVNLFRRAINDSFSFKSCVQTRLASELIMILLWCKQQTRGCAHGPQPGAITFYPSSHFYRFIPLLNIEKLLNINVSVEAEFDKKNRTRESKGIEAIIEFLRIYFIVHSFNYDEY